MNLAELTRTEPTREIVISSSKTETTHAVQSKQLQEQQQEKLIQDRVQKELLGEKERLIKLENEIKHREELAEQKAKVRIAELELEFLKKKIEDQEQILKLKEEINQKQALEIQQKFKDEQLAVQQQNLLQKENLERQRLQVQYSQA